MNRLCKQAAAILLTVICVIVWADPDNIAVLTVIQTTDIHGCTGKPDQHPGIARLGSVIQRERAKLKDGSDLLLIDTGDVTQGFFSASLDKGAFMVQALNELHYDVWVPGNHDFDYGPEILLRNLKRFKGSILAANLKVEGTQPDLILPWKLFRKSGLSVAVIGMIPPYLEQWIASDQLKGIHVEDITAALDRTMAEVNSSHPDLVILAVHLGESVSARLTKGKNSMYLSGIAKKWPQIKLILGGHTHQTAEGKRFYPDTLFVQAGALSDSAAAVEIRYDKISRKIVSVNSRIIPAEKEPELPAVQSVLKPLTEETDRLYRKKTAFVPFKLEPVKSLNARCRLAELFCQSMAEAVHTECALSTTLSRYVFKGGIMSEYQLFMLVPYENYISIVYLSPSQLKQILEDPVLLKYSKYAVSVSGIRFRRKADNSVELPMIRESVNRPWTDESEKLAFAVSSYAVSGAGGRMPELKRVGLLADSRKTGTEMTVRDAFRVYLRKNYPFVKGKKNYGHQ